MTRTEASPLPLAALLSAVLSLGVFLLAGGLSHAPEVSSTLRLLPVSSAPPLTAATSAPPLAFEASGSGAYRARGAGYELFLDRRGSQMALRGDSNTTLRTELVGANRHAVPGSDRRLPTVVNRYSGSDPAAWQTGIKTYGRVTYRGVYPGVDIRYHGADGRLEYDFVLGPGADPDRIALDFSGQSSLRLARNGDLLIGTDSGTVRQHRPVSYQHARGHRVPVESRFVIDGDRVSFELGRYDATRRLVIDPSLVFGDYIGGTDADAGQKVTLDSAGNLYIAGLSKSASIPGFTVARSKSTNTDAFVMKLSPSGVRQWISYLGGTSDDSANDVALDASGRVYITGWTDSQATFPATNNYARNAGGERDAYIARLTTAGQIDYAKFFIAPSTADFGLGIAVEGSGAAYITVSTFDSPTNPTTGAGYLTRYDASGVAQWTESRNFTAADTMTGVGVTPGCSSNCDVFVTGRSTCPAAICGSDTPMALTEKYSSADNWIWGYYWSTPATPSDPQHPEPSGGEAPAALAVDSHGNPAIIGTKYVTGHNYAFAARFDGSSGNPDPVNVTWQTGLLNGDSNGWDVAYDSEDNLLFGTSTVSSNDDTKDAIQTFQGSTDGQVVKYFPDGYPGSSHPAANIVWNTYVGGTAHDFVYGIATAPGAITYAVGETGSGNFLTSPLSQQKSTANDAFLIKIRTNSPTITDGPSGTSASRDVTFKYTSHETSGSFQCRLVGSGSPMPNFGSCGAQSQNFTGLPDGAYTFEITAFDEGHTTNGDVTTRAFTVDTTLHASFTISPNPVLAGRLVSLDASASGNAARPIAKYEWDLDGNGSYETNNGSNPVLQQIYPDAGTFNVGLRVTDKDGATATTTGELKVTSAGATGTQFGVTINDGAQFTNKPDVTVTSTFPSFTTGLLFSNDGGFGKAQTFAAKKETPWKLDSSGPERLPKTLYVRFLTGSIASTSFQDDIILDETPPKVDEAEIDAVGGDGTPATVEAAKAKLRKYKVKMKATDKTSGVSKVQVTANKKKPGKALKYKKRFVVKSAKRPKWVRARDRAGNWSKWKKAR